MEKKRNKVRAHLEKVEKIKSEKTTKEQQELEKQKEELNQRLENAAQKRGKIIDHIK